MYGNYKKKPYNGKKKKVYYPKATRKAYLAGLRAGKAMATRGRSKRRWY